MIRRYALGVGLAAFVVVVDAITKRWASIELVDGDIVIIPGFLVLTFTENPGAAFSMFENAGPFFGIAALTVTAALLWSLRHD
ncbi:MAG TPA: signal peptidase II, partial [Acidimicrobiia bacterium]|nr:signal peptidase II [Acidimicrobiia bacterium]